MEEGIGTGPEFRALSRRPSLVIPSPVAVEGTGSGPEFLRALSHRPGHRPGLVIPFRVSVVPNCAKAVGTGERSLRTFFLLTVCIVGFASDVHPLRAAEQRCHRQDRGVLLPDPGLTWIRSRGVRC